ncbi:MAG: ABC transporter ATP-binding protein [Candidatus Cohnella colombiensis]|uniref:ABC transporter ATP-binding protein n=1 Tax=Candidatus Cohnella colombiensis TaxID=3121368 RepID=A0AA95EWA1_9BACL|nr:MAG: ABC transporter ATP-binding protein [Cohnella sp.]
MPKVDVEVNRVSVKFRLDSEKIDSLKEYFLKLTMRSIEYTEFNALKSIDFKIHNGERIGIIGHNGAGKSTLLKTIAGVVKPTEGSVVVNGSIAPLLELGAGFDADLTGVENIFLNGAILGRSKKYLEEKFDEIVEYSGLGKFIHTPVKNYSSGMRARLGFSIATKVDPDILIVDEILGVGDENFQIKSSKTMKEMMTSGKTVILVSHNLAQVKQLTERVIWLHEGEVRQIGKTNELCREYKDYMDEILNKK